MSKKSRFRLQRTFFGLSSNYIEAIYEQFFYLKYYGGWSLFESYNLPIGLRNWFINKLNEQLKREAEEARKANGK